jgi:bifunctional DNA-binding transcriptional regulator/antitoxin component of YhaV-PrlF toxin-antitoxin module
MKVQKTKNGQYIVTIPKALAEALGYLRGTAIEFKINTEGDLIIKKK